MRKCGYTVQEECPVGEGKTVDLVARGKGKTIAIEIETGKSDAVANIHKCLAAGFDEVISATTSALVMRAVEKGTAELGESGSRVRVLIARELGNSGELGADVKGN